VKAIDIFTGIGGWNVALSTLGIQVIMAANHSQPSLATNRLNFPDTEQIHLDIMQCDPALIPDADLLCASPECTNHSHSKGVRLLSQNQLRLPGIWTDRSDDPFVTLSRETMNGVHRWAEIKALQGNPFKVIFLENVTDIYHWSGLNGWYANMEKLGYHAQTISFNSMFARPFPVPVPQSRDRCYIVLTRHGLPIPDIAIRPAAHCRFCQGEVEAIQCWRKTAQNVPFGDYGDQYDYRCPNCNTEVVPTSTPAYTVIDWDLPTPPIGDRTRPLCEETMLKIHKGLRWYTSLTPDQQARKTFMLSYYKNAVLRNVDGVAGTVTTRDRHALISLPTSWNPGEAAPDVNQCGYRMFTWYEYQRLMGLPESFRFACNVTERKRQLGLAVTPAAALEVVSRGLAALGHLDMYTHYSGNEDVA